MRDSYQTFFKYFKIDFSEIVKFGIDIDTIFPNPEKIDEDWYNLIDSIQNNKEVYIRGYGRDAKGTKLFLDLYKILLNNKNIKKDATNNSKPTQLLQRITNYSKIIKNDKGDMEKISNYQVAHIFGRTKNPFLFTAPWNIVWMSKMLDPFTGHESSGDYSDRFQFAFLEKAKQLYPDYISQYNKLAKSYFSPSKLESAFNKIRFETEIDEKTFHKFIKDATNELKIIE